MVVSVVALRTVDDHQRVPDLDVLDDAVRTPAVRLLPPPGFDRIAIPVPPREQFLYLCPIPTQSNETGQLELRGGSPRLGSGDEARRHSNEGNGAFALLIVEDNAITRRIKSTICDRWGQPYQLADNGQVALDMYKQNPERFRCIWMDTHMPVLDGYAATRQIRTLEQERWQAYTQAMLISSSQPNIEVPKPIRRTVILMHTRQSQEREAQRCTDAGADVVLTGVLRVHQIVNLLFSGPETNAVSLHGGVDAEDLRRAGYPLRVQPSRSRRTTEALERASGASD